MGVLRIPFGLVPLAVLALLCALGALTALGGPEDPCTRREAEPNWAISLATPCEYTLPCFPAIAVCGDARIGDQDLWRIPMDFHTAMLCEGETRLSVNTIGGEPVSLLLLNATKWKGKKSYELVGFWYDEHGQVSTDFIGVTYFHNGFDHLIAMVEVYSQTPAGYQLSYE
jgi:hypothetical protein